MSHTSVIGTTAAIPRGTKRKFGVDDLSLPSVEQGTPRKKYRLRSVQRIRRDRAQRKRGTISYFFTRLQEDSDLHPTAEEPEGPWRDPPADSNMPPYIPDPNFFFESGDIYAVADGVMCRIHSAKLASTGGLLDDLLGGPGKVRPSQEENKYDLPCFHVPMEVTIKEFRFLLAYIYGKIALYLRCYKGPENPWDHQDTVPSITSCDHWIYWEACTTLLKVSHKYNLVKIRFLVAQAFGALFYVNPDMDSNPATKIKIAGMRSEAEREAFLRTFPIRAIELFRMYDMPLYLPLAFYHAAQLSYKDITQGVKVGDELVKLDAVDIKDVLQGKEKLRKARREELLSWLPESVYEIDPTVDQFGKGCINCWKFLHALEEHFEDTGYFDQYTNGLAYLSEEGLRLIGHNLCEERDCKWRVVDRIQNAWTHYWRHIPEKFGLPEWDVLQREQKSIDDAWLGNY